MKHHDIVDSFGIEPDEFPPTPSSRIEHLTRKWQEEAEQQRGRGHRRASFRRRIEDLREERSLGRLFEDDLDLE